jgi:hypothetical protein
MEHSTTATQPREPWNKGKLVGQKAPFKLKDIWAIRIRLQIANRIRDLALFDLAIDSKLRACDLVKLRVRDVSHGDRLATRAVVMQQKTQRPVQFEITEQTREAVSKWIDRAGLKPEGFPAGCASHRTCPPASTPGSSIAGSVKSGWMQPPTGPTRCGAQKPPDLSADKEPQGGPTSLGHSKLESTVRYLGIEVDDALEMAEQTEV